MKVGRFASLQMNHPVAIKFRSHAIVVVSCHVFCAYGRIVVKPRAGLLIILFRHCVLCFKVCYVV